MQNTLKIKRTKPALAFNLAIIACEIAAIIIVFFKIGYYPLEYYTEDSNLFALVACAVMAGFQVRYLKSGKEIPHSVQMFKYMAAAVLSVTFIVVLAVLSPMRGEGINGWLYMLFNKDFTFLHTLCPILTILSFVLFEKEPHLDAKSAFTATIPTLLYAIVLIILNIVGIVGVVDGPYPFLRVMNQPLYMSFVWFIVIVGGAFFLALLLQKLNSTGRKSK